MSEMMAMIDQVFKHGGSVRFGDDCNVTLRVNDADGDTAWKFDGEGDSPGEALRNALETAKDELTD